MPKPAPRAWPRPPMAGRLIGNYMPIDGAAVEDRQDQGCQATGSIASLNCSCGTRYTAPKPLHRPSRSTDSAAMDSKRRDVGIASSSTGNASSSTGNASSSTGNASSSTGNASSSTGNASSSTGRSEASAIEVTTSVMLHTERAKASSIASDRPRADVDNFSWPSRRTSEQQDADIPDSAVDLMTPKMKAKAERLRETHPLRKKRTSSLGSRPRFTGQDDVQVYPSLPKTVLIMLSLYVSIFLVALDRTILGPAIPAITNQFNSIKDIGWYSSAYMLTSCGFILLYGRIYTFFPTKPVFLSGIVLFEIGSAICGAAQNSVMLITGRAIAGLGSSGVFTGAILIMLNTVPLHKRPLLQGLFGACFGVASVTGPLLGGAFTESGLTWRWCFYINIPLGGVTIVVVMFLLDLKENKPPRKDWRDTIRQMDPVGTILFLPGITCLLLALEWGAADYAWSSPRLVGLLTTFAVLITAFAVWQYFTRNTTATIPARILLQRSIACGCASQFCVGATMLTISVYVPLWFQAIKGVSAFQSGANSLPLVLATVFASILSGGVIQKVGYYTPFMIFGSCCMALGTGLITTLTMNTEKARWIGYLIIIGIGVGFSMQHANLAVQAILKKRDIPVGTAMLSLCQTLGGAVFTAVGQNLYIDKFTDSLRHIEGVDVSRVLDSGATALTNTVPPTVRGEVLKAYNNSLTHGTFFAVLFVACLSVPAALGMEWRSVRQDQSAKKEKATEDLEMGASKKGGAMNVMSVQDQMVHAGIQQEGSGLVAPPAPAWKKDHRPSGNFSQWLTVKVNPDLRLELGGTR